MQIDFKVGIRLQKLRRFVRELFYLFFGADSVVFVKNLQLQNAFIWENRKVLSDEENTSKHWAPQNRLCNIRLETH